MNNYFPNLFNISGLQQIPETKLAMNEGYLWDK